MICHIQIFEILDSEFEEGDGGDINVLIKGEIYKQLVIWWMILRLANDEYHSHKHKHNQSENLWNSFQEIQTNENLLTQFKIVKRIETSDNH